MLAVLVTGAVDPFVDKQNERYSLIDYKMASCASHDNDAQLTIL